MSDTVVHVRSPFQSGHLDSGDVTKFGPTAQNDDRLFTGGVDGQLVARDATSATGARWFDPSVLVGPAGPAGAAGASGAIGPTGPAGPSVWGGITGTLSTQTDLQTALGLLVPATRTVNGHALTADVTVTKGDLGLANVENTALSTGNALTATSAARWTTARALAGNSVDGSAAVAFANKFIVQGTVDAGLSAAQFLGALGTGLLKNTTTTGVLSIAVAGDFPTLNQSTTGSAATLTTPRAINGVTFDGSAAITVTAAAGTVTGATLAANVLASSLTSVGTLSNLTVTNPIAGSVTGAAGSVAASALTGTTLAAGVTGSSLTSLGTVATGTWQGTAVAAAFGGTGQTTYAVGDLLYASASNALSKLAAVAVGSYLRANGTTTAPLWSTLLLPNAATQGDLFVATGANAMGVVPAVALGQVLTSTGTGTVPAYSASPSVTSYRINGGQGAAGSADKIQKTVTGIADAVPTTVLTITIPNGAHSALIFLREVGSLGAGGAIGVNEASSAKSYCVTVTRTPGVNAVATVSPAFGSAAAAVAGATTAGSSIAAAAVAGAVGATNTIDLQVTVARGGGASTNHGCQLLAEVLNANASGVTIA